MSEREFAMTSWPDGRSCVRPKAVLDAAQRMQKWALGQAETCHGCHTLSAVSIRAGLPLCGRCREQRAIRSGDVVDMLGRQVRAEPDEEPTGVQLRGNAIVFNSRSEFLGFYEYIKPAAVDRTLSERIDVRALWSHNPDLTIGRLSAGTLRMRKTTRALAVEIDPPRWAAGQVESVKRRDVQGMSFAFDALDDDWHLEDGIPVRDVLDMRVFEVSGVSFPAYESTTLKAVSSGERSDWQAEDAARERLRWAR